MGAKLGLYRFLDTTGDGTGTKDASGDYSLAQTDFKISPAAGDRMEITRMIVTISDAGAPDSGKYGNNIDLSAGVGIYVRKYDSSGLVTDYTAGIPIKTNADWGRYCHDVKPIEWGLGDDYVSVRWTFSKAGNPIYLDGDSSEELRVELNDDLSALVEHYFHVQGELHDAS